MTTALTFKDLTAKVAEQLELTETQADETVRTTFEVIAEALVEGAEVAVPGFGKFVVADTAARTGRNPSTGEALDIPAGKRVSFKASSVLKRSVKEA